MGPFTIVARLIDLYGMLIVVYVIVGWVSIASRSAGVRSFERALAAVCDPFLALFRRILPPAATGASGLDFSPFIALIVLQVLSRAIARLG